MARTPALPSKRTATAAIKKTAEDSIVIENFIDARKSRRRIIEVLGGDSSCPHTAALDKYSAGWHADQAANGE